MTDMFDFYIVGGYVRDKLLNRKSNDIDYCAIAKHKIDINNQYESLCNYLESNNHTIFLKNKECFTIRTKNNLTNECADYVLARKECGYNLDSRKPIIEPGSLYDDLIRRDFTINAIAIDIQTGEYINYFNGISDIESKCLKTIQDANITLMDDPLRILRGLRFSITLGFDLDQNFIDALSNEKIWEKFSKVVSSDRIRVELEKMFKENTVRTLKLFNQINNISNNFYEIIFLNIDLFAKIKHIHK
jgi:poly(A) polymerase